MTRSKTCLQNVNKTTETESSNVFKGKSLRNGNQCKKNLVIRTRTLLSQPDGLDS